MVVEAAALVQKRLGMTAVRTLLDEMLPAILVHWVDADLHAASAAAFVAANRRGLSLVDCTSLELMRRLALTRAFTFDDHVREQGFALVEPPAPAPAPAGEPRR